MKNINKIVNFKKHPINSSKKYMSLCRAKLKKNLILKLDDFLTTEALLNLRKEAKMLHKKAFYCSQKHTILLDKKNNMMSRNDPCNLEIISDKGCVPHDLIPNSSHLNSLYYKG